MFFSSIPSLLLFVLKRLLSVSLSCLDGACVAPRPWNATLLFDSSIFISVCTSLASVSCGVLCIVVTNQAPHSFHVILFSENHKCTLIPLLRSMFCPLCRQKCQHRPSWSGMKLCLVVCYQWMCVMTGLQYWGEEKNQASVKACIISPAGKHLLVFLFTWESKTSSCTYINSSYNIQVCAVEAEIGKHFNNQSSHIHTHAHAPAESISHMHAPAAENSFVLPH